MRIITVLLVLVMSVNVLEPLAVNLDGTGDKSSNVTTDEVATRGTGTVYFNDFYSDIMVLGNANYYEIGFNKSNGAIVYIKDKSTNENVTLGSNDEFLWMANFPTSSEPCVGGYDYSSTGPNRFNYNWSDAANTLTLTYIPDPDSARQVIANVTIVASDEPYFDMQITIVNNWGNDLESVKFPSELMIPKSWIERALLPTSLPGIMLSSSFFAENRACGFLYPPALADYLALQTRHSNLTLYSVWASDPIKPVMSGLWYDDYKDCYLLDHAFQMWVNDSQSWTSAPVRVRTSQTFMETLSNYRMDTNLNTFSSLEEKLGDKFETVAQAPLLYIAAGESTSLGFKDWPEMLTQLPSPAIIMLSCYYTAEPGTLALHGHHPDYLPPDPEWGTTEELKAVFEAAHNLSMLMMPFTLPIWWHENSTTLQNLPAPLTINDIAVLVDEVGTPLWSEWEENAGGYYMSPYHPFVQQRMDQMLYELTQVLPSDMIYEDVLGAHEWRVDFNPSEPTPMHWIEGWINHTRTFNERGGLLVSETGYDRLAEAEVGFMGGTYKAKDLWDGVFGAGNWREYPMAPLLMGDKVLFFQYWTGQSKDQLSWNLAFGCRHNLNLYLDDPEIHEPWLDILTEFQAHVGSRYTGKRMTNYTESGNITESVFEDITVLRNWDNVSSYSTGGYTIAPEGMLVTSTSGDLIAGIFTKYNNVSLSSGELVTPICVRDAPLNSSEHYIIEERNASGITVRQPFGNDTILTLKLLANWNTTDSFNVLAYTREGGLIATVPLNVTAEGITFTYLQHVNGQNTSYYRIIKGENALPIANFTYMPEKPVINKTITFNATNSTDPDGDIVNYEWDFDDGNITNTTEPIITHSYSLPGNYTVNLTVTDDDNATDSCSMEITVSEELLPAAVLLCEPTDITANSIQLSWSQNNDTDFGNYTIYQSTASGVLGNAIKVITTNTVTSWTVMDLLPSRTYYFTVRTYDASGLHNDSNQVSATTLSAQVVETIGPSGGNVTLEKLTVTIPPNTLSENVSFNITTVSIAPPEGYGIVGCVYNIECAVTTFTNPITITLSYAGITLPENVSEDGLAIYKRTDNTWNKLGGTIDKINKTISVEITTLSDFAIFYKTPIEEEEEEGKPPAKPFDIPWLYIIIPVIVIVVLTAVGISISRRKKGTPPPEKT